MTEGSSVPFNVGDLAKPITTLIEKMADAGAGFFHPYQIRRVAQAEADAKLIKAQSEIDIKDLKQRALSRVVAVEQRNQRNIENIANKTFPKLPENADASKVNEDWMANFLEKCKIVSDEEMQVLWSNILAGEVTSPGRYSKRTVNFLGEMEKGDAEALATICSFSFYKSQTGSLSPLIYSLTDPIYADNGINLTVLWQLQNLGLINFSTMGSYSSELNETNNRYEYHGDFFTIKPGTLFEIGIVRFTQLARELGRVCKPVKVKGLYNHVIKTIPKGLIVKSSKPRN